MDAHDTGGGGALTPFEGVSRSTPATVGSLAFSLDGETLAFLSLEGLVRFWVVSP